MPLTMESAAALVPGAPLPTTTRRVVVLRPFMRDRAPVPVGAELTVSIFDAAELIGAGKARLAPPAPEPPTTLPAPAAKAAGKATK